MGWIASPLKLKRLTVLGLNKRNADVVMRYNPRHLYPLVDDKLKTKQKALSQQISVPELYGVVEIQHQVKTLEPLLAAHTEFVIKPAQGSGGNGIVVIVGRFGKNYKKPNGDLISFDFIQHHISNVLSGMYSLGGVTDKAIIEYRVQSDPFFESLSYQGVPDIRVIVFRGVPIAAMVRLPTRASDGKANLHQGAVGMGIDLATGISRKGVIRNKICTLHPDTEKNIEGLTIPNWNAILTLAIRCADLVGLGYLGVDIVMDKYLGPMMLELNARPGLNVQLANQQGLGHNLDKVAAITQLPTSVEERLTLAQTLSLN
ncbi:MAG TPA: alpha-L-glutamate ligase-like protein [Gammaproteobacteria bacterium]|nr:alpha-L-glutamate ligase-like protein [Gammaproteobacteria bacterium]